MSAPRGERCLGETTSRWLQAHLQSDGSRALDSWRAKAWLAVYGDQVHPRRRRR